MAYIPRQIPESEENKFALSSPTTPLPVQSGGSAGEGGQNAGGGAPPGVGTTTQFGSNAANLSSYLDANKGQVQELGNKIAGNLTQGYNDVVGGINQNFGQFGQSVNQGANNPDWSKVDQAASNPSDFVKDPNNVSQFQSWFNSEYKGPQNVETADFYSDTNNRVNKAVEDASLVNSYSGLGSYLDNYLGGNNRTQGMKTLDTALLYKSPEASQTIRDAASPYKTLSYFLSGKVSEANKSVEQAKKSSSENRMKIQDKFLGENGAVDQFGKKISGNVSSARTEAADRIAKAQEALSGKAATTDKGAMALKPEFKQALQDLGISEEDYLDAIHKQRVLSGGYSSPQYSFASTPFDFNTYANFLSPDAQILPENVASGDDFLTQQALSALTGQNLSYLNPNLSDQAGKSNLDLSDLNVREMLDNLNRIFREKVGPIPKVPEREPIRSGERGKLGAH